MSGPSNRRTVTGRDQAIAYVGAKSRIARATDTGSSGVRRDPGLQVNPREQPGRPEEGGARKRPPRGFCQFWLVVPRFLATVLTECRVSGLSGGHLRSFVFSALERHLPRLTAATHEFLSRSAYNSAYIFNMLSLQGTPVVYEWDRQSGWRRRGPAPSNEGRGQPAAKAQDVGLRTIQFLQSLGPQPGPGSLSDGLGPTFFPELLAAFRHREPTPGEIQ